MKIMNVSKVTLAVVLGLSLAACGGDDGTDGVNGTDGVAGTNGTNGVTTFVSRVDVVTSNANIAYAVYADSLISAISLKTALQTFVDMPSDSNFVAAKQAWFDAREPYGQSEVYRFRVGPIDALKDDGTIGEEGDGPEGRLNAWPLGEALIDYVSVNGVDGNAFAEDGTPIITTNIIADTVSYPTIDAATIAGLFEEGDDERSVTTGYHAIEFLLWGQDLNNDGAGTGDRDNTAGQRAASDYYAAATGDYSACTSGDEAKAASVCQRRADYLLAAADLLIDDLEPVVEAWEPTTGSYYNEFVAGGDTSLAKILEGMGRLSYGELAGERINIALVTNSQEDEHSCFSDNTHRDIYLNAKGVQNAFTATYTRISGEEISGASVYDLLLTEGFTELANELRGSLEATMSAASVIDTKAKSGTPFDVLIQEGTDQANVKAVISALVTQTDDIEQVIINLGVTTSNIYQDTEEEI